MGTTTAYVPYDYRRLCDLCGNLYNISKMYRDGPYTYCFDHAGERISEKLDRGNARQRPFRILPVPNAKPEDQSQPDVFESEESLVFSLLDAAIASGARYMSIVSGSATALPVATDVIPTCAWACVHYYGIATASYPRGHVDLWHAQALARMRTAADVLLTKQTVTGSRATNSFYGGLLGTGSAFYYAEDAMVGGLALLYAYRLLGDLKYLYGARAAANFLRNLQAIGLAGVNFTSTDSAGTARLYTGGITSYVSTVTGFFSDHRFYPSAQLTLWFWNELTMTDGDQTIGATAPIVSEFTLAPAASMSSAMRDLRTFWLTGTFDAVTRVVRNGFSTTTPAECFNAFPATKANTSITGTGAWEYQDGPSASGTLVTALNFAKAMAALYAVDGLSDQVNAFDTWLWSFVANPAYATPAVTSAASLARSTTGTFTSATAPPTLLLVRTPVTLATTAMNGSSLYDWGAFGLLSPIVSRRHTATFKYGRINGAQQRRRLSDGKPSDGNWDDRGFMRGRAGLSYQTAFVDTLDHGGAVATTTGIVYDAVAAAQFAVSLRQAPRA